MSGPGLTGAKVLVTGAGGFMGSHLVERLVEGEARVAVLLRRTSTSSLPGSHQNLHQAWDRIDRVLEADLSLPDWWGRARSWAPDVVLHLGADAFVTASFDAPREVFRTNLDGTLSVLEFCRTHPVRRLVLVSSSEVYGHHPGPIHEACATRPTTPYAASKLAADRAAYSYWRAYGLPVVICRPFNTYGPRHPYDVVPQFLHRAHRGEPLLVYGSGNQSRDLTYVDDMVEALIRVAAADGHEGEVFNFGTGRSTTIRDLAEMVLEVTGAEVEIRHVSARPGEVEKLECDPSRANRNFGWRAMTDLRVGLSRCWAWVGSDPHRLHRRPRAGYPPPASGF